MEINLDKKYLAHYETPPKEGHNVIKFKCHADFGMSMFLLAWEHVCKEVGKLVWPERIILGNSMPLMLGGIDYIKTYDALDRIFGITFHNSGDYDEWWIIFRDTDKIFYSAGV